MDNPQIVKLCNEGLRPAAYHLAVAYYAAKALVQSYDAIGAAALLGDDNTYSDLVADGSETDGRPRISAGGVKLTIENLRGLISQLETTDSGTGMTMVQGVLSISPRYNGN